MSRILIGESGGQNVYLDLDVFLRTRLLITSNSGGGKSYTIRRLAEQLFGHLQVILIDPEGEFASLREKYGYVLVGKGGETPADPRSAAMLAHKLLELKASAVCDLYEMKPMDRHRWVKLFLDSLIDAPKKFWHPVVVILDEAHLMAPEKGAGESEASESVISLATRGRKRGFACCLATQRLSKLRKDAAAELLNILVGPTFMDADRERAADALGVARSDRQKFFDQIKVLEPGNFFGLGRAICLERKLIHIGPVETTHPESGSAKHAAEPPPAPEKVKALLPKLADLPRAAEEQAKTVAEFKSEIRSLRAELRAQPIKSETKEIRIVDQTVISKAMAKRDSFYAGELKRLMSGIASIAKTAANLAAIKISIPQEPIVMKRLAPEKIRTGQEVVKRLAAQVPISNNGDGVEAKGIVAGALRMLSALVQWYPQGMTQGQLRAHAGLRKSGTYSTYLSRLRAAGLIEERGGLFYATDSGVDYCGENRIEPPMTTEEVVALWKPKLNASGAQRMLDVLVAHGGEAISKDQLAEEAGIVVSGTFSTYLSRLRTAKLASVERSGMIAADRETLFL